MSCKNNGLDINPGDSPRNLEDAARHLPDPSPPENHTATIPQGYPAYPGKPRQIIWGTNTPLRPREGGTAPHSSPLDKRSSSSCCAMAGARNRTGPGRPARRHVMHRIHEIAGAKRAARAITAESSPDHLHTIRRTNFPELSKPARKQGSRQSHAAGPGRGPQNSPPLKSRRPYRAGSHAYTRHSIEARFPDEAPIFVEVDRCACRGSAMFHRALAPTPASTRNPGKARSRCW